MINTPYYLVDKSALLRNLEKIAYVREHSGAKALLALKCFATWSVFDLMRQYMDGTTSSSLYEVKLGREKFGGETHAYSVAYADDEIDEVVANCRQDHLQLDRPARALRRQGRRCARAACASTRRSVRRASTSPIRRGRSAGLANGTRRKIEARHRPHQRLHDPQQLRERRFRAVRPHARRRSRRNSARCCDQVEWVSLGGGIHFTGEGYPLDAFCERLKALSRALRRAGLSGARRGRHHARARRWK